MSRILAVDWGERRIGLAISDPLGMIASPAGHIERRAGKRPPIAKVIAKARELEATSFVLGLPLDGEGDDTPRATEVRAIAAEIEKRTGMPVELVDERYTTSAARRAVREMGGRPQDRPGDIDALAATRLDAFETALRGDAILSSLPLKQQKVCVSRTALAVHHDNRRTTIGVDDLQIVYDSGGKARRDLSRLIEGKTFNGRRGVFSRFGSETGFTVVAQRSRRHL